MNKQWALRWIMTGWMVWAGATAYGEEAVRDGVFVHITHSHDNPHRLLMALNMAYMMADDHDVLVYFDIEGVHAVLADAEDVTFSHFPSLHTQIPRLIEKGVTLMACPGCLLVLEKTADDLADGVQAADKTRFFSFTDGRILTLDY
jgi:predicted peroxiredoxin